jgi:hypothetical protein
VHLYVPKTEKQLANIKEFFRASAEVSLQQKQLVAVMTETGTVLKGLAHYIRELPGSFMTVRKRDFGFGGKPSGLYHVQIGIPLFYKQKGVVLTRCFVDRHMAYPHIFFKTIHSYLHRWLPEKSANLIDRLQVLTAVLLWRESLPDNLLHPHANPNYFFQFDKLLAIGKHREELKKMRDTVCDIVLPPKGLSSGIPNQLPTVKSERDLYEWNKQGLLLASETNEPPALSDSIRIKAMQNALHSGSRLEKARKQYQEQMEQYAKAGWVTLGGSYSTQN